MKKKIVYIGPYASGYTVDPRNSRQYHFSNGVAIEVPGDFADLLLAEQPTENADWILSTDK